MYGPVSTFFSLHLSPALQRSGHRLAVHIFDVSPCWNPLSDTRHRYSHRFDNLGEVVCGCIALHCGVRRQDDLRYATLLQTIQELCYLQLLRPYPVQRSYGAVQHVIVPFKYPRRLDGQEIASLDRPGELAAWNASELAEHAEVSNATVSRLVRRLGYGSYDEARRAAEESDAT